MSVTDPLIKELKGCVQQLMKFDKITDDCADLTPFSETLERIFYQGLVLRGESIPPPWQWLNAVEFEMDRGVIPRVFAYVRCVEETRECLKVTTDRGKFRVLVRCCLKHRCLHVPVEIMVRHIGTKKHAWYQSTSVLGHEVLGEILLSVLLQVSHLSFDVDTTNARFLDYSWQLPITLTTLFVPCQTLGLVVTFHDELAVVVSVERASVAAEDDKIEPGDIIDELNENIVTADLRGKLKGILSKCRNQPITVRAVKVRCSSPEHAFLPCVVLYRRNPALCHLTGPQSNMAQSKGEEKQNIKYLGCCAVGRRGDVSLVEEGIRRVVADKQEPRPVTIECRELDLLVMYDGKVLMRHPYVAVASCGHSINYPRHFACMVGDAPCNSATEYTCHVFAATSHEICATVLLGLGLGFDRTQCAV